MKRQLLRNQTIIVDVTSPILEHTINIPGDVHGFSQKSIRNGSKLYTNRYTNRCIYILIYLDKYKYMYIYMYPHVYICIYKYIYIYTY